MHKMRAVSEKCRYMQLPLQMRISVPETKQTASINPAKAKLRVRNTKRHLRKHLMPRIANATPTGIAPLISLMQRERGRGIAGRNTARDVRLPAAAARKHLNDVSLV